MYRVYLAAVDVVPAAVVLLPLFLLFYISKYGRSVSKCLLYCIFCLYLSAVFSLVGLPNVTYVRPEPNLNLIPFWGIVDDWKNSILNVILFMPLGFLLPVVWEYYRKMAHVVYFGLGLSLGIELLQMLTFRATDVNDLITNTAGTVLGFIIAQPFYLKCSAVSKNHRAACWLSFLSFAVMFFIHPVLSPLIWDRIL